MVSPLAASSHAVAAASRTVMRPLPPQGKTPIPKRKNDIVSFSDFWEEALSKGETIRSPQASCRQRLSFFNWPIQNRQKPLPHSTSDFVPL